MDIKRTGMKIIQETNVGVYLWKLPNGHYLADEQGRMLSCDAIQGDLRVITEMNAAARECGYPDGEAVWEPANQCTAEEYEEQVDDLLSGKNPTVRIVRR